jgi:hypothetical protein
MANWITHEYIVDNILNKGLSLDKKGFCVGNIAPDCNLENADWTEYIPPREKTHWMSGAKKTDDDYKRFFHEIIKEQKFESIEHLSYLLGYYAHLITDVEFNKFMNDEKHIQVVFERLKAEKNMKNQIKGYPETKDTLKKVFGKRGFLYDIVIFENNYVLNNPDCAYNRILRNIQQFTDYLEIFPKGAITRKINIMAYEVTEPLKQEKFFFFTNDEYEDFIDRTSNKVYELLVETGYC